MIDFLLFKTFITPQVLIIFYIIGAFIIPFFSWLFKIWIQNRYFNQIKFQIKLRYKVLLYSMFFCCFLLMELFWRMIFEMMIAYFDMHDALMALKP